MATKKKSNNKKPVKTAKLPGVLELLKSSLSDCRKFWRPLTGVIVVYGILYFILVLGLSFQTVSSSTGASGHLSHALRSAFTVFNTGNTSSTTNQSDATVLMQFLLFMIASLAVIWTLRKLQDVKKIKIRDAYYQGSSGLISTILVTFCLIITLLPALLGGAILATATQTSSSGAEVFIAGIISVLLLLGSIYLFVVYWPAFYIAGLPQMRPIQAMRSAAKVTKKRRFIIMGRMLVLLIATLCFLFLILLILALTVSKIVPEVAYLLLLVIFGYAHVYLYKLYRSLL